MNLAVDAKAAIARAQRELDEEAMEAATGVLKRKYKQLQNAKLVVTNIEREIEDLEQAITDGNLEELL